MKYNQKLLGDIMPRKTKMKDIAGFEGLYGITEDGRGWRYPSESYVGRWLTPILNCKCDSPVFCLNMQGKRKTISVCKIVATAFNENLHDFSKVEFIDGNIHNPHKDNIKWVPSGKMCVINGVTFESEFKASKHYGILKSTFKNRRQLGWTLEESLELKKREYDFVKYSGFIYLITDKTNNKQYVGQTKTDVNIRIESHFNAAKLLKSPSTKSLQYALKNKDRKDFVISVIDSVKTASMLNEREKFFINELSTMSPNGYNLNSGGGVGIYKNKISYKGKTYSSYAEIARSYVVDQAVVKARMGKGLTIGQALGDEPIVNRVVNIKREVEYAGIKYSSVAKLCKALEIPRTTIASRLNRGMSVKEAVEYQFNSNAPRPKYLPVEIEGVVYKSKKEASKAYGIPYKVFIKRLTEGWELDSAIGIKPRIQWHKN